MARGPTLPTPERPHLTPDQKRQRIRRFQECMNDLRAFDPTTLPGRSQNPIVTTLEASIDRALVSAFGHGTIDYKRYADAIQLDHGPRTLQMGGTFGRQRYEDPREWQGYFEQGKQQALALLGQAVRQLEEEVEDEGGQLEIVSESALSPLSPAISASDRFVRIDHNSDPYKEAIAALDDVEAQLGTLGNATDAETYDLVKAELSAGRTLFQAPVFRASAVGLVLGGALAAISAIFPDFGISIAANAAWALVLACFRRFA